MRAHSACSPSGCPVRQGDAYPTSSSPNYPKWFQHDLFSWYICLGNREFGVIGLTFSLLIIPSSPHNLLNKDYVPYNDLDKYLVYDFDTIIKLNKDILGIVNYIIELIEMLNNNQINVIDVNAE